MRLVGELRRGVLPFHCDDDGVLVGRIGVEL